MSVPSNLSNKLVTTNALWDILGEVTTNIYNNMPKPETVDISGKANINNPTFGGYIQLGNGVAIGNNTTAMGSGRIFNLSTITINSSNKKYVTLAEADKNYNIAPGDVLYIPSYGSYVIASYNNSSGIIILLSAVNTSATSVAGCQIKQGPVAYEADAHAEGTGTGAIGTASHAEGNKTLALGRYSHAEGSLTEASEQYAHAEGIGAKASGEAAHAEGNAAAASGDISHAEGSDTTASGGMAHAEGYRTIASADSSHAEGHQTTASKPYSHAEGYITTASGEASHAEGHDTVASGKYSHAEGDNTIASGDFSHVIGTYNIEDTIPYWASNTFYKVGDLVQASNANNATTFKKYKCIQDHTSEGTFDSYRLRDYWKIASTAHYVEIVGNGTTTNLRSNARTLDWAGNEWLAGNLTAAGGTFTLGATALTEAQLQALKALSSAIGDIHSFDVQVVQTLPVENIEDHTIYFVPKQGASNDVYDEYLYINNAWELIGSTQIDLTGYATQTYVNDALAAAETLPTPGENGTGLVSVNGEWIKTPGYGYAATEEFVVGNFTSTDFTQEGAKYIATIPLTEEIMNGLSGMLMSQEGFNVMIDDTIYNSVTDQFTFTDEGIQLQNVFKISPNSDSTAVIFSVSTVPNSAKIYQTTTTYTQFDRRLLPLDLNVKNGAGTMAVLINDIENNTASGNYATSEGYYTRAAANYSHAEGYQSYAQGQNSHAEGNGTITKGTDSHSEGSHTEAVGEGSHAEGRNTIAGGLYSHAEGNGPDLMHTPMQIIAEADATNRIYSVDTLSGIHVDDFVFATNINEIQKFIQITEIDSENLQIKLVERVLAGQYDVYRYGALGEASHTEGSRNIAMNYSAHAEGYTTIAKGHASHAEGYKTNAARASSHAEGEETISGHTSHSEGYKTMANAFRSHAEGSQTITVYRIQNSSGTHAEGRNTAAFGSGAHSEGVSSGYLSGVKVLLTGEQSNDSQNGHTVNYKFQTNTDYNSRYADTAVGMYLVYTGQDVFYNWLKITAVDTSNQTFQVINPHPALNETVFMLVNNIAIGDASHTEGSGTQAIGVRSHAEGLETIANDDDQHVQGRFNIEAPNNTYAHIVGNGKNENNRSNAHTLDWNGNAWYAGKVTAGTVASPANPTAANDLTTKQYVDNALAAKVVSIEGTTPAITAVADTQYICGEVSTLSFTPSATGISDIIFESGSTATVLTVPNTVKFPDWFDATALETNMVYEISIMNGTYGAVMAWATT